MLEETKKTLDLEVSSTLTCCIFSKSRDKFSVGVACKGVLLQLPVPLKIKKKLRDKLPNIQETHLWGQVLDFKSLTLKVKKTENSTFSFVPLISILMFCVLTNNQCPNNFLYLSYLLLKQSMSFQIQKYRETTKIDVDMQNSVLEWNFHFSNLIMELMPQFIIMLPVLASVKSGSSATPAKPRTLGPLFICFQYLASS